MSVRYTQDKGLAVHGESLRSSPHQACMHTRSGMSSSLRPYGPWSTRLFCPWEFLGKYNGVDCHFLLQGIFLTQGLNPCVLCLLHCRWILYHLSHWGSPPELPTIWKPRISDLRTMLATQRFPTLHTFVLLWIRRGF